ncbi:MAG: hypothetical protein ACRC4N_03610, partial [Gammaproteobacteria bacterium]
MNNKWHPGGERSPFRLPSKANSSLPRARERASEMSLSLPKRQAVELSFIFHGMSLRSSVGMWEKVFHAEQLKPNPIRSKRNK